METVALLIMAGVFIMYLHSPPTVASVPVEPMDVSREVDVLRWRHDGSQPMYWTRGNAEPFTDTTVYSLIHS